jgi:hypothetical protein
MKPDELLDDLGRLARTQEAQAAAGEVIADELLRPLDAAAHDRVAARLLPLVQPARAPVPSSTVRRRPRLPSWIVVVVPALAAALVLLWLRWPRADAALPAYALELHGGRMAERGAAETAVIQVGAADAVSAVLRPATAVSGPVAVWVFVDGRALPDAPPRVVERSTAGALRISGLGPALTALLPGRHRLQFAVGRPGSLSAAVVEAPSPSTRGVQLLGYEVDRLSP